MQSETQALRTLILVKHSLPQIDPTQPATQWPLSEEGRRRCGALAESLAPWQPEIIIASEERKAAQTAELTAQHLDIPWRTAPGLQEHDRSNAPYRADEAAFHARVAALFARPEERVFGVETAHDALTRFSTALAAALADAAAPSARSIAVVAHGTVIALYVAHRFGLDGFDLWRRLGLPALVVTDAPNLAAPLEIAQIG